MAIDRASTAGEWSVVAQLARELEARRLAAAHVALLPRKGPQDTPKGEGRSMVVDVASVDAGGRRRRR